MFAVASLIQNSGVKTKCSRAITYSLFGSLMISAIPTEAWAGSQIFLKFPAIVGSSAFIKHVGEIIITGFTANASFTPPNGGGGGGGVGKVVCGQVTFVKPIDQTSPLFLGLLFKGRATPGPVTITFEKNETTYDFYKPTFAG
jgi:type VI protein secretion system component Hcp